MTGRGAAALAAALLLAGWRSEGTGPRPPARAAGTGPDPEPSEQPFRPGRAPFPVVAGGLQVRYRTFLLPVLPDSPVPLRVAAEAEAGGAAVGARVDGRELGRGPGGGWSWRAPPEPGLHRIVLSRQARGDSVVLNAVVLVPFDRLRGGRVERYRIGTYPEKPYRGLPRYRHPAGFVELTPELADVRVSPHFRLGQFPCKLPSGWPKYLPPPDPLLLEKLERMLAEVNRRGIPARTFRMLSGFRSPWYNHRIGRPTYSRHIYGDAADIYVDRDMDGVMDDLNGDGRIDLADAHLLWEIAERMDRSPATRHLLGGLGEYPVTENHGPFVHVDTRGYRARW